MCAITIKQSRIMKKILIIEDHQDVRENTVDILELAHYNVETAEDGIIGIEKVKSFQPDLIICDIMMPKMDGYEVFHWLQEDTKTAQIPFIFLTAKSENTDVRNGMRIGADDYLIKPFEEEDLLNAIACRLKKHLFLKEEFRRDLAGINDYLEEVKQNLDLERLIGNLDLQDYQKKEELFREGDAAHALYYLKSGNIKTAMLSASGKELVTGFHTTGDFLGQVSLFNIKGTYIETATVIEDAELYTIPKDDFISFLFTNKVVSNQFINMISHSLINAQEQLLHMAFGSVRQRLAKALLDLCNKDDQINNLNLGISIPREDLAGIIGTAPETAIRMLTEFKDQGLITMGRRRRIMIENKSRLKHIANYN